MPYYQWQAIDLTGTIRSGRMRALSLEELERELLARDMGLMNARTKNIFFSTLCQSDVIFFFRRMSALLSAGVYLQEALKIVLAKTRSPKLADVIERLHADVERGIFFHDALLAHPKIFEPFMIHMWRVAHEGSLGEGIALLCHYLEERHALKKKLQKAASMPALTAFFFVIIFMALLFGIVPRFADMFSSLTIELPASTKTLLLISNTIQHVSWSSSVVGVCITSVLVRLMIKHTRATSLFHTVMLKIPYINALIIERDLYVFFKALTVLLKARVPLDQALSCATSVIHNKKIRMTSEAVAQCVREGTAFDQALEETIFVDAEMIALITVGLRSGQLADLVMEVGNLSHERMARRLTFLTHIVQPLLLIILATCIVSLILAVYIPIITLSYSIA